MVLKGARKPLKLPEDGEGGHGRSRAVSQGWQAASCEPLTPVGWHTSAVSPAWQLLTLGVYGTARARHTRANRCIAPPGAVGGHMGHVMRRARLNGLHSYYQREAA
jgi:hypothetical protein